MQSLLRLWRKQASRCSPRSRICKETTQADHKQAAAQPARHFRAAHSSNKRLQATQCASSSQEYSSVVAGIPVSSANTIDGQGLWQTLQHQQLDFVPQVQKCLGELAAQSSHDSGQQDRVLASTRRTALLEDVLYYWAVAEAYLADTSIQALFRQAILMHCALTDSVCSLSNSDCILRDMQ